ncbi:bifunctional diguanylate cyclase/phosphodiesterase [Jeotgalibacillus aurantiacus]|uniref:bifunctional diguanylate cyclase/phosphodiesterase n=1 Tax=Jeotgalibacillus aurantiacus TaxID=2763266 RepID=UPI001D0A529E|nr:EAL domain-containing protein [Jeotgalibacillus aurantiacus]
MGEYNLFLVTGSLLIAIFSSYAALLLVKKMIQENKRSRKGLWLTSGSLIFGAGIWCMHFVAMLAYHLIMPVSYHPGLLFLSIVFAAISSFTAFLLLNKKVITSRVIIFGSVFISISILSMHYIGMEAMRMQADIVYNLWIVALSALIAVVASYAALRIFIYFSFQKNSSAFIGPAISAVIMGIAISGMHYTGMASATFDHSAHHAVQDVTGLDQNTIGSIIAIAMLIILSFVFIVIFYDKKMALANQRLTMTDQLYRSIMDAANDAVITTDGNGAVLSWNKAAETIFGYGKSEMMDQPLSVILPGYELSSDNDKQTLVLKGKHKNNKTFPIELSFSSVKNESQLYYTGIIRNISERVKQQKKIEELVYKDPLTNLPNRRMLNEELGKMIHSASNTGQEVAAAFIDMDRFKQVNDVYGHQTGDLLLKAMADRMSHLLKYEDLIGRQSGDEFIILSPASSPFQISTKANAVLTAFKDPFLIGNTEIFMSPSIGISLYPQDGITADELIKHADMAMYKAKELGGAHFQFFTSEINDEISSKMKMESGLRKAIMNEELEVYYQPLVSIHDNQINGVEALIRWHSKELGTVSPADFIPLAEETNLILPIGEWVLRKACTQFTEWKKSNYMPGHLAVNISSIQFKQEDFPQLVRKVLEETGMPPHCLVLEVTETVIQDVEKSLPTLHSLKEMGIKLSLDDFGTGYSSLQYLKDFPLDIIKIDKSFVQSLLISPKNQAVVDMIINMAEQLEMEVIAEGVESEDQRKYLATRESIFYQGYLYSPPLTFEELTSQLVSQSVQRLAE